MTKKRSGDNYPTDIKGQMMFIGSIVCVPYVTISGTQELRLGYISKITQKRGFDVTIYHDEFTNDVMRITNPHNSVNVIEKSQLKTMDKFHEAIRMAAALAAAD